MSVDELLRYAERSFVWHAVGDVAHDLVRQLASFAPLAIILLGCLLVLAIGIGALRGQRGRGGRADWTSSAAAYPPPARESSYANVQCACGRKWSVRC